MILLYTIPEIISTISATLGIIVSGILISDRLKGKFNFVSRLTRKRDKSGIRHYEKKNPVKKFDKSHTLFLTLSYLSIFIIFIGIPLLYFIYIGETYGYDLSKVTKWKQYSIIYAPYCFYYAFIIRSIPSFYMKLFMKYPSISYNSSKIKSNIPRADMCFLISIISIAILFVTLVIFLIYSLLDKRAPSVLFLAFATSMFVNCISEAIEFKERTL